VFNPWVSRRVRVGRAVEFLFHMSHLNRRMHNKTYIADGRFAIIGGRNIGTRYFGLNERFVQDDLDVLMAGSGVDDVTASFDSFWNGRSTLQAALVMTPKGRESKLQETRTKIAHEVEADAGLLESFPLQPKDWTAYLDDLPKTYASGRGSLIYDPANRDDSSRPRLYPEFKRFIESAEHEVLICSPYFIPDADFRDLIRRLVARGVRVAILTNSLATNNHEVAHTGYKRWRRDVLASGAELYELREGATAIDEYVTPPITGRHLGLHTKAIVVDSRYTFIGSPNVDPRSMVLNTEIGVVTDSPELNRRLRALIERDMSPANAWRVTMDGDGWLKWSSGDRQVTRQPAKGFGQRFVEFLINLFPLKKQA
jgi:putative cardiolipin synthase